MSVRVMAMVWACEKLDGPRLITMLALADFANDDGGSIWPSVTTLAKKTRRNLRATQYALRELEQLGFISPAGKRPDVGTTVYQINLQSLAMPGAGVQRIAPGGDAKNCTGGVQFNDKKGAKNCTQSINEPSMNNYISDAHAALTFLNEKAGTDFRATHPNGEPTKSITLIVALLKKGYALQEIKTVTMRMVREWKGDEKMRQFLRPSTLYRPNKFAEYHARCTDSAAA